MVRLCQRLDDRQVSALISALAREPGHMYFPKVANVLEDLSVGRAVKTAGRLDQGPGDGFSYDFDAMEE